MLVGKREAVRWSATEEEILIHSSPDEAMEEYLDARVFPDDGGVESLREQLHDIGDVVVQGYAHMEVSPQEVGEYALETVDECMLSDLANPDDSSTYWSEETKAAARAFGKAVLNDFYVWAMEPITTVTINALAWAEKYEAQWFVEKEAV